MLLVFYLGYLPASDYWRGKVTTLDFNLIDLFEKQVLSGKKEFVDSLFNGYDNASNVLLIGSDIYENNSKLILDPRLLMDELHSFWFIEMLKLIVDKFEICNDGKQTAIVIDNSPGYIGVSKSIREWLCSLGPEFGKFLLVTSLDNQDVLATANSANEIVQLMESMNRVAVYCQSKGEKGGDYREVVSSPLLTRFYNTLKEKPGIYLSSNESITIPKAYTQVVFNKVPRQCIEEGWHYAFNDAMGGIYDERIAQLMRDGQDKPLNAIYYHDRLSTQFISGFLVNNSISSDSIMETLSIIRDEDTSINYSYAFLQRQKNLNSLANQLVVNNYKPLSKQLLSLFDYYSVGTSFSTLVKSLPSPTNISSSYQCDISKFIQFHLRQLNEFSKYWDSSDYGFQVIASIISSSFEYLFKNRYRKDRIIALSALWTAFFWHHQNTIQTGEFISNSNLNDYLAKTYSSRVDYSRFNEMLSKVAVDEVAYVNYSGLSIGEFGRFNKAVVNVLVSQMNLDVDKEIIYSLVTRILESSEHKIPNPLYEYLKKSRSTVKNYKDYSEQENIIFEMKDITSILNGIIKGWSI